MDVYPDTCNSGDHDHRYRGKFHGIKKYWCDDCDLPVAVGVKRVFKNPERVERERRGNTLTGLKLAKRFGPAYVRFMEALASRETPCHGGHDLFDGYEGNDRIETGGNNRQAWKTKQRQREMAAILCQGCPIRDACLEYAREARKDLQPGAILSGHYIDAKHNVLPIKTPAILERSA